jgi:ABC-type multidrug transport system fused ATPase/permease subunit
MYSLFPLYLLYFFYFYRLKASQLFHDQVFVSVMRATPAWFDRQPVGRILARFTSDLDQIDTVIPGNLEQTAELQITILFSLVLICIILPSFTLTLIPIAIVFLFVSRYFRVSARVLKRLDNLSKAPLVQHTQATVLGIASIRAFRRENTFKNENFKLVDDTAVTHWAFYAINRWLACRLDNITTLIAAITVSFCIAARDYLTPSFAALCIVSALQTVGIFQFSVRLFTETENQMSSVERLAVYANDIPHESLIAPNSHILDEVSTRKCLESFDKDYFLLAKNNTNKKMFKNQIKNIFPHIQNASFTFGWDSSSWNKILMQTSWPLFGGLSFSNVSARYRDGLPLVLKDVSFYVAPGMSVGVVGRTGAGKTTLTLALFRMMELAGGSITLDGIDISEINIYQLRSRLAVLPQDPVLYAGTLRYNFDPFGEADDASIEAVVDLAGLRNLVSSHPLGLQRLVTEGGLNVSHGERQLIALARALLRGAKVVVCDEATASVDDATDAIVQKTIRGSMANCSLIVIAHRLATIIDCDRVLVMGDGKVLEYDHPAALLGMIPRREPIRNTSIDGQGTFQAMVNDTGPETALMLRKAAVEAANIRSK